MKLVWRETLAPHQPYGLLWELVDEELRFNDADVSVWLSPTYAYIHRTGKRGYEASLYVLPTAAAANKTFRSLKQAKAWVQTLAVLNQ